MAAAPRRILGQNLFLAAAILIACAVVGYLLLPGKRGGNGEAGAAVSRLRLGDIPFNGTRAYEYLKQLCDLGRRPSGSPGMAAQQKLLADHFSKLGGQVEFQRFQGRHPLGGQAVPMANLIVRWHPQSKQRILLAAHYDTRPYPTEDPANPQGDFIGANDGASGVAVLMELAHEMGELPSKYGVDFVLLDAEEFVFGRQENERGTYFLGSEHFAREYAKSRAPYRYRWGVLLDMVGDADLQIYQEAQSIGWKDTRPLVEDIWRTAARLGVREFIARPFYESDSWGRAVPRAIRDDHLALHDLGQIPTCDIIDFDYPSWHTQGDTPEKCSALSLAKVGWVLREWLKGAR